MAARYFLWVVYFLSARFFLETREEKSHRGLYQENRVDVLENSNPVLLTIMSHFWPCSYW